MDSSLIIGLGVLAGAGLLVYVAYSQGNKIQEERDVKGIHDTQGVDAQLVDKWRNANVGGYTQPDQFTRSLDPTLENSGKKTFSDLFKDTASSAQGLVDSVVEVVGRGLGASIVTQGGPDTAVPVLPGTLTDLKPPENSKNSNRSFLQLISY